MSEYQQHQPDELLERYLDDLLTDEERIAFDRLLQTMPELRCAVEEDRRFQDRMRRTFLPPDRSTPAIETILSQTDTPKTAKTNSLDNDFTTTAFGSPASRRRRIIAALGTIAAVIAWIVVLIQYDGNKTIEPFFEQRPLVLIYREVVDQGFRPYYFCEDQVRFARTFAKRQTIPLQLTQTPADRKMVGLSYLGGLSRNTTAMLAYVENEPVVVFVDRKEFDNVSRMTANANRSNFNVHRSELGELVLYEVSPFDSVKMTPYLKLQPN